ncbi:MAG: GC-type dockerin domain-anchored protein [Planctomycetota bacterium]
MRSTKNVSAALSVAMLAGSAMAQPLIPLSDLNAQGFPDFSVYPAVGSQDRPIDSTAATVLQTPVDFFIVDDPATPGVRDLRALFRQDDEADYTVQELAEFDRVDPSLFPVGEPTAGLPLAALRVGDSIRLQGDTAIVNGPFPLDRIALYANSSRFLVGLGFDQRLPELIYAFRTAEAGQITITQNDAGGEPNFEHALMQFADRGGISDFNLFGDSSFFTFVSLTSISGVLENGSFGFFAPSEFLLSVDGNDGTTVGGFDLNLSLEPAPPLERIINEQALLTPGDGSMGSASSVVIMNTTAGQESAIRNYRNALLQTALIIDGAEYAVGLDLVGTGILRGVQLEPFATEDTNDHDYIVLDDPDESTRNILELTGEQPADANQTGSLVNTADTYFYDSFTQDVLGVVGDPLNPDPNLQTRFVAVIDTNEVDGPFEKQYQFLSLTTGVTVDDDTTLAGNGNRDIRVQGNTQFDEAEVFAYNTLKGGQVLGPPDPEDIYALHIGAANPANDPLGAILTYVQNEDPNLTTQPQRNPAFHRWVLFQANEQGDIQREFEIQDIRGGGITSIVPIVVGGLDFEDEDGLANFDEIGQVAGQPLTLVYEPFAAHEIPGPELLGDAFATPIIPAGDYFISIEEITKQAQDAPYDINFRVQEVSDFVDLGVFGDPNGLVEITTVGGGPGSLSDPALAVFDGSTGELLLRKANNNLNIFNPSLNDLQATIVTGLDPFASPFDIGRVQLGSEETFVFIAQDSANNNIQDDGLTFTLGDPRFSVGDYGFILSGANVPSGEDHVQLTINQVTLSGGEVDTRTELASAQVQIESNRIGIARFRLGTRPSADVVITPPATVADMGAIGNSGERLSWTTSSNPGITGNQTNFDTGMAIFRSNGRLYDVGSDGGQFFDFFADNFGATQATLIGGRAIASTAPGDSYFLAVYSDRPNAGIDIDGSIEANFFIGSGPGTGSYLLTVGDSTIVNAVPGSNVEVNISGDANAFQINESIGAGEIDWYTFQVDRAFADAAAFEAELARRVSLNGTPGSVSDENPAQPLEDFTGTPIPFGTRLAIQVADADAGTVNPVTGELENSAVAVDKFAIWDDQGNLIRQQSGSDRLFSAEIEGLILQPGTYYGAISGRISSVDDEWIMYSEAFNFGSAWAGDTLGGELPIDFLDQATGQQLIPRRFITMPQANTSRDRVDAILEPDSATFNNTATYFKFVVAPPASPFQVPASSGVVDESGTVSIRTANASFGIDTELGLYDAAGNLLAIQDDITNFTQPGGLLSELNGLELDPGDYVVAVSTNPSGYADNFLVARNAGGLENGGGFRVGGSFNPFIVGEGIGLNTGGGFTAITPSNGGTADLIIEGSAGDNLDDIEITFPAIGVGQTLVNGELSDATFITFTVGQVPAENSLDCDGNGVVNISDLFCFITNFTSVPPAPSSDFDGNGVINISDLFAYITAFTAQP